LAQSLSVGSYVGTLVEINSENSTVALENVMSYGTESRRTGEEFFPPSSSLYDYIVFKGKDVKDLRIEEETKESSPQPPTIPNDPAILGVSCSNRRPRVKFYGTMMKYSGCKIHITPEAQNPVWSFPLPSF
jgi:Scd6-like Sm domain